MSSRESILATLREHSAELNNAGLLHLRLFGSAARDEANRDSDIDLLADFNTTVPLSLLAISRLQNRLSELLNAQVDLSSTSWLKDGVRERVLQESIRAF